MSLKRCTYKGGIFKVWIKNNEVKVDKMQGKIEKVRELGNFTFGIGRNTVYKLGESSVEPLFQIAIDVKEISLENNIFYVIDQVGRIILFDLLANKNIFFSENENKDRCISKGNQILSTKNLIKVASLKGEVLSRVENPAGETLTLLTNDSSFAVFKYSNGLVLWLHAEQRLEHVTFKEINLS